MLPLRSPFAAHRSSAALAQRRVRGGSGGSRCWLCSREPTTCGLAVGGVACRTGSSSRQRRRRQASKAGAKQEAGPSEDGEDGEEKATPRSQQSWKNTSFAGQCAMAAVVAGNLEDENSEEFNMEDVPPPKDFQNTALAKFFKQKLQFVQDKINYAEMLPPLGSQQISYTRFLELLHTRKIKRIIMLNEGRVAIIDTPAQGFASDYEAQITVNRFDPTIKYKGNETIEPQMEKFRYYVELPGDIWEDGLVMQAIKKNAYPLVNEDGRVRYGDLRQHHQVTTELSMFDTKEVQFWGSEYIDQLQPVFALLGLRLAVAVGGFIYKLVTRAKKDAMRELADKYGEMQVRQFNTQLESTEETGVRYSDVAGVDDIKQRIKEVTDMMLGKSEFLSVGAHPPRGILLEGPPGTGKTLLAKAMAGESGLPFFTANGSEFVEMYQGVAQTRVKQLFILARSFAPAIIFIDEIDALGRARGSGMQDEGSREREQGLLQLLYELDGVKQGDKVLLLAATNRANLLDPALLRPGRMDKIIYMGLPSTTNRFEILQVHARNKPVPREGDDMYPSDALLHRTAALTIGYSGAELANLMNEAAILTVRYNLPEITSDLIREAMDKRQFGLGRKRLPSSDAKLALASVEAGRAVVCALTPGIPPIVHVTIQPRGDVTARISFLPQEVSPQGDSSPQLYAGGPHGPKKINAVPAGPPITLYEMVVGLLVPLYASRATEEVLYGADRTTLRTSEQMADAGQLAHWLVKRCYMHPARRGPPLEYGHALEYVGDAITEDAISGFEELTLSLQRVAYRRAMRVVRERRPVIEQLGQELCHPPEGSPELVSGERIVALLESTPLAQRDESWEEFGVAGGTDDEAFAHTFGSGLRGASAYGEAAFGLEAGRSGVASFGFSDLQGTRVPWRDVRVEKETWREAAEAVLGRLDLQELSAKGLKLEAALELEARLEDETERARMVAQRRFYQTPLEGPGAAPFPPPPADESLRLNRGDALEDWMDPEYETTVYEDVPVDALFAPSR